MRGSSPLAGWAVAHTPEGMEMTMSVWGASHPASVSQSPTSTAERLPRVTAGVWWDSGGHLRHKGTMRFNPLILTLLLRLHHLGLVLHPI